ncbi:MAG: hydroxyacid dehydrogenase [Desulfurococcaceae archaeon]
MLVASKIHEGGVEILRASGVEIAFVEEPPVEELARLIKGFDGIIVRSRPLVTRSVIEAADSLKVIARAGVGVDNIDVDAARSRNIEVITVPEATTTSVAELAVGLMVAVARKIAYCDREIRRGEWPKKQAVGSELSGKVLGILGAGRIGSLVAKIAKYGFNMQILYYDISRNKRLEEEVGAKHMSVEDVLRSADIISVHVPLTPETKHMINEERLKLMKRTAILINTARGAVIDESALVKALKEGWIAGAGLDVYEEEPLPADHALAKLDNVVLTSHIGASTHEAQVRASEDVAKRLVEFFRARGYLS